MFIFFVVYITSSLLRCATIYMSRNCASLFQNGCTTLHLASANGHIEVADDLITQHGSHVDFKTNVSRKRCSDGKQWTWCVFVVRGSVCYCSLIQVLWYAFRWSLLWCTLYLTCNFVVCFSRGVVRHCTWRLLMVMRQWQIAQSPNIQRTQRRERR